MTRSGGASVEEIELVYRARLPEFRRVAAAILGGDRDGARDAVQDAFALALRERRKYRRAGSLDAWLLEDRGQRRPRRTAASATRARASEQSRRLVLFLRFYADLDYVTIADAAGIGPGTVAATLNAAHHSIRRLLQEVPA